VSTRSVHILLHHLIDYAGLFPPASLSMSAAVRNYAAYRRGAQVWALGRLVLPVARLDEFDAAAAPFLPPGDEQAWRLSVICTADLAADLARIDDFCRSHATRAVIDCLELRLPDEAAIASVNAALLDGRLAYVEMAPGAGVERRVETLHKAGLRAKLRTGGVTAEAIPSVADVYGFLRACHTFGVAFKATAGLHHAVRGSHYLTTPEGPRARMHGFLNLFLAAAFLHQGMPEAELLQLLDESSERAFRADEMAIHWRGRRLEASTLAHVRATQATSFGSCSFVDPMDDLTAMGLLAR
jgi:hypothetical protein